jgi:hypothetical protein
VWLARRRARRSRDVEPAKTPAKDGDDTPNASRPVLHRFGRTDTDQLTVVEPEPRKRAAKRRPDRDERPLLDEVAFVEDADFEEDETGDVELPPPPPRAKPARKPAAKKPSPPRKPPPPGDKLDYIPLDDL